MIGGASEDGLRVNLGLEETGFAGIWVSLGSINCKELREFKLN